MRLCVPRRLTVFLFSLLVVSCGGSGGSRDDGPLVEKILRSPEDRIYLHGEAIDDDTLVIAWGPGGEATLCGRPLRPPPPRPVEDDRDRRARYGRVPLVKRLTGEGKSLAEGVDEFRRAEEDVRRRLSLAYQSALSGAAEEEATLAALRSLTEEDRALLDGDPVPGAGVVEVRFAGRPRETWILRSPGKGGRGTPGAMSRSEVAEWAGILRTALDSSPALAVLGKTIHVVHGPEEIGRAASQIEGAWEERAEEGPLPPEALRPFHPEQ